MSAVSDAPSGSLAPELEDYRQQFERNTADASGLVEGLTDAQFNWRAAPGRWSIAECVVHLNLTARAYLPVIDEAIARAGARGLRGDGPPDYGIIGRWFLRSLEPPPKRRYKAPKLARVAAAHHHDLAAVMPEFEELHSQLQHRIQGANGLDLRRARLTSPFFRLLKLRLGACFAIIAAHERRHLWQAGQVRTAPGFPGEKSLGSSVIGSG